MADANDVADWMASQVEVEGFLYRDWAVAHIADEFGDEFVYKDENGNPEISETVLTTFYKLTEGSVFWDRWDRCWRQRVAEDPPGVSRN
jgi:hypothetical protein